MYALHQTRGAASDLWSTATESSTPDNCKDALSMLSTIANSDSDSEKTVGASSSDLSNRQFAKAVKALHVPIGDPEEASASGVTGSFRPTNGTTAKPKLVQAGHHIAVPSSILITADSNTVAIGTLGTAAPLADIKESNAALHSEPAEYHPPLPDDRWYVIIVGFQVGVFTSW
jgi:hypothetical protein